MKYTEAGLASFLRGLMARFVRWRINTKMSASSNSHLEEGYNFLVKTLEQAHMVADNAEVIIEGAKSGQAKIKDDDGEGALDLSTAEEIVKNARSVISQLAETMENLNAEVKKRNLKVNQLPNGKYYFMEQKVASLDKEAGLSLWQKIQRRALKLVHDIVLIPRYTIQELEQVYNQSVDTANTLQKMSEISTGTPIKVTGGDEPDEEYKMSNEHFEDFSETCSELLSEVTDSKKKIEAEIKKRALILNQLPNGKYYLMEQKVAFMKMNSTRYSLRNAERFVAMNKVAGTDPIDVLQRAMAMSENDRKEYIKNFTKEHGLKEVFSIVKNSIDSILHSQPKDEEIVATAAMYEGFNKDRKEVIDPSEDNAKPTSKEQAHPLDSRVKTVLEKLGDWSVLLTFFLMWAAMSTSDYHELVIKQSDVHAEIKMFLIASGAAFMAWAFKYLRSLLK